MKIPFFCQPYYTIVLTVWKGTSDFVCRNLIPKQAHSNNCHLLCTTLLTHSNSLFQNLSELAQLYHSIICSILLLAGSVYLLQAYLLTPTYDRPNYYRNACLLQAYLLTQRLSTAGLPRPTI